MPARRIDKMISDATAVLATAIDVVPKMPPGKRDVFVADLVCAMSKKLQGQFGYDSTIWGLNAAAERLRIAHHKQETVRRRAARRDT